MKTLLNLAISFLKHQIFRRIGNNKFKFLLFCLVFYIIFKYYRNRDEIDQYLDIKFADPAYISTEEKFLVYRCDAYYDKNRNCGGLGDRIKGIVSGYVWALITNRTFLIDMNRPCDFTNLYLPNKYNWNKYDNNIDKLFQSENIGYFDKAVLNGDDFFKERFSYINFTLLKQTKKVIIFLSNRNLLETISKNKHPHIQNRIKELGFDPKKFDMPYTFRYIYNLLFKLNPNLQEKYERFLLKAKPNKDTQLICAQIRIGGHKHFYYREYYDYRPQFLNDTSNYWKHIREHFISKTKDNNYRIYISTDNEIARKEAIKEFGREFIVYNEGPLNHVDFVQNKNNDCSHIENTILDFHSFQLCDMAAISPSQFGMIGVWNREDSAKDVFMYEPSQRLFFQIKSYSEFHAT